MSDPRPADLPGYDPDRIRRLAPIVRMMRRYFRAEVSGFEHLPEGPALLVGNHSGGMASPDTWLVAEEFYRRTGYREPLVFLGHSVVVRSPIVGGLLRSGGAIEAGSDGAIRHLQAGRKVMVYPGGDREAMRPSRDRDRVDFGGRSGFVRLALQAGVPIVPVASCGSHDGWIVLTRGERIAKALRLDRALRVNVFPVSLAFPWGVMIGPITPHIPMPVKIRIRFLDPIQLTGSPDDPEAIREGAGRVIAALQDAVHDLRQGRDSGPPGRLRL